MRVTLPTLLWLLATVCCFAQQQEQTLMDRLDADPRKHPYANPMGAKKFEGGGDLNLNTSKDGSMTFSGAKSYDAGTYETRSFFGIKNPWFGNKVYETSPLDLTDKSTLNNADKKFAVDAAKTKDFDQSDKTAPVPKDGVKTDTYVVKGAAQGSVDQLKKNLTIDDVREILNKNH